MVRSVGVLASVRAIDSVAMLRQVSRWLLMYSRAMADSISHELDVGSKSTKCFHNADVMSDLTIVKLVSSELYS